MNKGDKPRAKAFTCVVVRHRLTFAPRILRPGDPKILEHLLKSWAKAFAFLGAGGLITFAPRILWSGDPKILEHLLKSRAKAFAFLGSGGFITFAPRIWNWEFPILEQGGQTSGESVYLCSCQTSINFRPKNFEAWRPQNP